MYSMVMLLYQTLKLTLGYDTVLRCCGACDDWLQAATLHSKLRPNRCR